MDLTITSIREETSEINAFELRSPSGLLKVKHLWSPHT